MSGKKIDHIEQAESLLAEQYKQPLFPLPAPPEEPKKSRFRQYIELFMRQGNELEDAYNDILNKRHLDVAVGEQLDVIGRIVGINRILVDADDLKFLTFTDSAAPITDIERAWGDVDNPEIGGIWRDINQRPTGNIRLSDEQYRVFIRAKIIKNHTDCTFESLIAFYKEMFGQEVVIDIRESPGAFEINIGKDLNENDKLIFRVKDELGRYLVPKPLGIRMSVYYYDPDEVYTYDAPPGLGYDQGRYISQVL